MTNCWNGKKESEGKTALLIEGARRIGKSTVVEEFAKNEYESYILIDFSIASKATIQLFDDISDLNYIFLQLQLQFKTIYMTQSKNWYYIQSGVSGNTGYSIL